MTIDDLLEYIFPNSSWKELNKSNSASNQQGYV